MAGKIVAAMITFFTITIIYLLGIFYSQQETIKDRINDINYGVVEAVSTKGILNTNLYDYLKRNIDNLGDYKIVLKLEKYVKPGVYDTYFDNSDIIDKYLQEGDIITIYIQKKSPTTFAKLLNASLLMWKSDRYTELSVSSIKSAPVSQKNKNLQKGYDVISEIKTRAINGEFTTSGVALLVITKFNPTGKYYGLAGHAYVTTTNIAYGDTADESGNTGLNYIFDNGDFIKEVEYYPSGLEKLIRYIQQ